MISKLAKMEVASLEHDGLKPAFEDIIKLNALGLKVEHGKEDTEFTYLPRHAFLGDIILEEPSLKKRLFMDKCFDVLQNDYYTRLFMIAWALCLPDDALPRLDDVKKLTDDINMFKMRVIGFTERQLLAAIDYVMQGNDPTADEEFYGGNEDGKLEEIIGIPSQIKSVAQHLYVEMLQVGIDERAAGMTMPIVSRMIWNAIMINGADVKKNEQAQNAARYYAFVGKLRTRLYNEKQQKTTLN